VCSLNRWRALSVKALGLLSAQYVSLARTVGFHLVARTDLEKWKGYTFPREWAARSKRIVELIPLGSHVFEYGAGPAGLRAYLHPSCTLISSDLVERSAGMMIIDLNRRPLPEPGGMQPRIAVFGGVLEYLSDLPSLMPWLANHFATCIASYECARVRTTLFDGLREIVHRTRVGWLNHYTEAEFKSLFANAGFKLVDRTTWGVDDPGLIFVFELQEQSRP
jgi:hypothetical protein